MTRSADDKSARFREAADHAPSLAEAARAIVNFVSDANRLWTKSMMDDLRAALAAHDAAPVDERLECITCESCGGTDTVVEGEAICGGCGKTVCQTCVTVFDHWKGGDHGVGDPSDEMGRLRTAIAVLRRSPQPDALSELRALREWVSGGTPHPLGCVDSEHRRGMRSACLDFEAELDRRIAALESKGSPSPHSSAEEQDGSNVKVGGSNPPGDTTPPEADDEIDRRIDAAIERIKSGRASMRIPVDQTDPDVVLADCQIALRRERERANEAEEYSLTAMVERNKARAENEHLVTSLNVQQALNERLRAVKEAAEVQAVGCSCCCALCEGVRSAVAALGEAKGDG